MASVPEASSKGFTRGSAYESRRPSYPPEAVDSLLRHLQVNSVTGAKTLDVGAETGKLTDLLAGRDEIFEVVVVEPHNEMREQLEKKRLKGVRILRGDAWGSQRQIRSLMPSLLLKYAYVYYMLYPIHCLRVGLSELCTLPGIPSVRQLTFMITPLLKDQRFADDQVFRKIYRGLAPGGAFDMIWNIEDCELLV